MHEKELRLALICYGGVSLAVYMHGITREIWHLARASQAFHADVAADSATEKLYRDIIARAAEGSGVSVRVLVDILAGASAGGINAIFLADAIASGSSLEPLTALWLDGADVERLIDPEVNAFSRFAKAAALPFAWALSGRGGGDERSEDAAQRAEVRAKIASFVRARWFAPPFGGAGFTAVLLEAIEAMRREGSGTPLLPPGHPLDLAVTVTDFHGFPQKLRLNSPPEVLETEHRLTFSFRAAGGGRLADVPDLVFAARATASFPGAFPPFTAAELDKVLRSRGRDWPGRAGFLARAFPRRSLEQAEEAVLIDGSTLANAPFRPAIAALQNRPARREVDRRFVYVDPKPGIRTVRVGRSGKAEAPGFFATIFGALSDIPREQPIRDNLEAIEARSLRIRRMNRIVEAIRPQVEAAIARAFGGGFFVRAPTPARLAAWRLRAHRLAARHAGFAYAAYGQLKLARVVEESILHLSRAGGAEPARGMRSRIWEAVRLAGIATDDAFTAAGASAPAIAFLGRFDVGFRIRRLRFLARTVQRHRAERPELRALLDTLIARYRAAASAQVAPDKGGDAAAALERLAATLDLVAIDAEADAELARALASLPRPERKTLIVAYIGFPFYDIATLPLLQEDGHDEFDPIKVDRISPDDAVAIRTGGAAATLKGIRFSSFGAFFSRAWRENDYLWGRLHGADRLVDILLSTLPGHGIDAAAAKRDAFRAILAEEKERLTGIAPLIETLEREIG